MLKLLQNCTYLIHQQSNAQNSSSQTSTVHEPRTSDVQAGFRIGRGTTDQIANIHWIIEKASELQKNTYFCFIDYAKAFQCVVHTKLWKILQEMGLPDHLTCLLRNLYAGQEATIRTRYGTMDCFKIGKGVLQGCILSPCVFVCVCVSCSVLSDFLRPRGLQPQSMWITKNCGKFLERWEYQTT